jgi:hypothetical protein
MALYSLLTRYSWRTISKLAASATKEGRTNYGSLRLPCSDARAPIGRSNDQDQNSWSQSLESEYYFRSSPGLSCFCNRRQWSVRSGLVLA